MLGIFENLVKALVGAVVETPIAVVADVVTLGGSLSDKDEPYTVTSVNKVLENLGEATK